MNDVEDECDHVRSHAIFSYLPMSRRSRCRPGIPNMRDTWRGLTRTRAWQGDRIAKPYDHERWSAAPVTRRPPPPSPPGDLPGVLTPGHARRGDVILGSASHLDAVSASPQRDIATRLLAVAGQPEHQRSRRSGPLVLGAAPLTSPTPTTDRDRTVSRRSEPSSRAAFMGEQPNPWDRLQPQDATSRHRGAKPCRRCELLGKISLLSPG